MAQACSGPPLSQAPLPSDWERAHEKRAWRESEVELPAYPRRADLLPFFVSAASRFEFFVDGSSLSPGEDGVVRYVLVARSPQGTETVTYEGIRCSTAEFRIYASGIGDRRWVRSSSAWRPIEQRSVQRWHNALRNEYFCPLGNPVRRAAEAVGALRRGAQSGHAPGVD